MKVLDKLKNLKLRRWGDNIFTDAVNKRGGVMTRPQKDI